MNKYFVVLIILCFCFPGCIRGPRLPKIPSPVDKDKVGELGDGGIIDAVTSRVKGAEGHHTESGTTAGQSWLFFLLTGFLVIAGVVAMACKEVFAAGSCMIGAVVMAIMPSIIEAVHAALDGFVIFFYGFLILCFICLLLWVVYKVFNFVPNKKKNEILNAVNKEVQTDEIDSGSK